MPISLEPILKMIIQKIPSCIRFNFVRYGGLYLCYVILIFVALVLVFVLIENIHSSQCSHLNITHLKINLLFRFSIRKVFLLHNFHNFFNFLPSKSTIKFEKVRRHKLGELKISKTCPVNAKIHNGRKTQGKQ